MCRAGQSRDHAALFAQIRRQARTRRAASHVWTLAAASVRPERGQRVARDDCHRRCRRPRRARSAAASSRRRVAHSIRRARRSRRGLLADRRRAHERRGLVGRKEVSIVGQHDEVVPRDQSVGRIAVDDVDLPGGQRLIFHRRPKRPHVAKAQPVRRLQSREVRRGAQ